MFPVFEEHSLTRENGWIPLFTESSIPNATGPRPRMIFSRELVEVVDGQRMVNRQTTTLTFAGGRYQQGDIHSIRFILPNE
jgi:hypothetical protein